MISCHMSLLSSGGVAWALDYLRERWLGLRWVMRLVRHSTWLGGTTDWSLPISWVEGRSAWPLGSRPTTREGVSVIGLPLVATDLDENAAYRDHLGYVECNFIALSGPRIYL